MSESPFARIFSLWKTKKLWPMLLLLSAGLVLLALSSLGEKDASGETRAVFDEEAYTASLEERTERLLSSVEGVGEVHVMLTMDSVWEEHYATDQSVSEHQAGESKEANIQQSIILQSEKNGTKTPILQSVTMPRVRGVSVVCTGGSNAAVQMKVMSLVQALFDLDANRISVTN